MNTNGKNYNMVMGFVVLIVLFFVTIGCDVDVGKTDYETGAEYLEKEDYGYYLLATDYLRKVPSSSKYYDDAQQKLKIAEEKIAEKNYQSGLKSIKEGKWEDATVNLVNLKKDKYKDSYVLYAYASAEETLTEGDFGLMMRYLEYIPDDYQGDLADEILQRKQEILDNKDELKIEMKARAEKSAKERLHSSALLERVSFNWYKSSRSHVRAEGEVKNISDVPLRNVKAVITYKSKEGDFITYDSALIEYNPIMPEQTSPFSVISTYNPLMETAYLEFQFLSGEKIPHYFE
jgi:hypothetical protein